MAITVGLAWALNRDNLPPAPSTFRAPAPITPVNVYEIKEANADGLVLGSADGATDIRVPRPTTIDTVLPGGSLSAGDWVNVIGIVDEVRNFSIRADTGAALGAAVLAWTTGPGRLGVPGSR